MGARGRVGEWASGREDERDRIAELKAWGAVPAVRTDAPVRWPHGTRARYTSASCRCDRCRHANSEYQRRRARAIARGEGNPIVDAAPAREHLIELSRRGIGRRAVGDATDLNNCNLWKIWRGERTRIRKRTAELILAVDESARGNCSLVDAAPSWRRLRELLGCGYSKKQLASWMGCKAKVPSIQLRHDRITAINAVRVERVYNLLQQGRLSR